MEQEIKTIKLPLPFGTGTVNCYLIKVDDGHILIDTGGSKNRKAILRELESVGCRPGSLKLIVLTHGDFDHTGNAAFLRKTLGGKIAMHHDDLRMVEQGDMFANRKKPNILIRKLLPRFSGFGKSERFTPDFIIKDDDDLNEYGVDARVISIPGHSRGSIGIMTAGGVLFCGDLLENVDEPRLNSLTDDLTVANASLQKLKNMGVGTVYPGHGKPFEISSVPSGST